MKKQKIVERFEPEVTLDQMLAYDPAREETHTKFGIVNAVCKRMFRKNEVLLPEQVAASLGWPRVKLTNAMEVLTGYNLADLRVEMMAKRWREYRNAHPGCKPHELAAVLGFDNYNSYWRFMNRNMKKFPELQEEEDSLRGHVMSAMERPMHGESTAVRRLYGMLPYRGGKAEAEACAMLLYRHGVKVAEVAEEVMLRHPELDVKREKIRDAALLKMVGIVWTDKPELHCHGLEPFGSYPQKSSSFLDKHKMRTAALCALYPYPNEAQTTHAEMILDYASCFYSIFNPEHRQTLDKIRTGLAQYGPAAVKRFDELHRMFG